MQSSIFKLFKNVYIGTLLFGCVSLLAVIPCYFLDRSYVKAAQIYEATIVAFTKVENRDGRQWYNIVAKFNSNGTERTLKSYTDCEYDASIRDQKLGTKLSILYRDGDKYFRMNTLTCKWLWTGMASAFGIMSLAFVAVCYVIYRIFVAARRPPK